jgi:DNA polymerase-1
VRSKLRENRDKAFLSRQLVQLEHGVPLENEPDDYRPLPPRRRELIELFQELDFKSFLQALKKEAEEAGEAEGAGEAETSVAPPPPGASVERKIEIVRTEQGFSALLERLSGRERFSIDLETTSQDAMRAEIVGIAVSLEDYAGYYIPVAHTGEGSEPQLSRERVLEGLKPLLEAGRPQKIGQNLKYEWVVFKRRGIELIGIGFDTMVASYLLDPGNRTHKLDRLAQEHLGESMITYAEVAGKGKDHKGFAAVDVDKAAEYAVEDAEVVWRLTPILERKLDEIGLLELFCTLELPLVEVLAAMEHTGIALDAGQLRKLSLDLQKLLDQRADRVHQLAGMEFNIQSPKQLGEVLFQQLRLPVVKKTKTGPSTDMSVLETLAIDHPIAEEVLAYRSLAKLKGTYVDALPELVHPQTGRIHSSFNQTVTATGRLSSSDPNLQNIPIRTPEGREIRKAFLPSVGCVLMAADYSQIELRILAHCSEDPALVQAFRDGADIHRRTAAEMYGTPPHEVDPAMRRQAKAINFGIIYGMGPYGLSQQLRISQTEAKANIERYFERYKGVRTFIDRVIEETRTRGYSETLLGRRRPILELASRNKNIQRQGERLAVNTTIQGTAADLIKQAMIDLHAAIREQGMRSAMVLQVHDELVFEVPLEEREAMEELVRNKMENVTELKVPLQVDMGVGENWKDAHS